MLELFISFWVNENGATIYGQVVEKNSVLDTSNPKIWLAVVERAAFNELQAKYDKLFHEHHQTRIIPSLATEAK
jgi:hypothetical protein